MLGGKACGTRRRVKCKKAPATGEGLRSRGVSIRRAGQSQPSSRTFQIGKVSVRYLSGGQHIAKDRCGVCGDLVGSVVPNRAARADAGSALAWIAARIFGVVVACL